MDNLLCLLEKYRCHLNRGNRSSVDFLRDNYSEYISDVKAALSPKDNQLVGAEMCKMVSEQNLCRGILALIVKKPILEYVQ